MKRVVFAAVIASAVGLGAPKNRAWQTGTIVTSKTTTDSVEHSGEGHGLLTTVIANRTTTTNSTQTQILGGGFSYLVIDHRKHPCPFIEGDDIQYEHQKAKLDVLDADGKECKLDIIRQVRLEPKP